MLYLCYWIREVGGRALISVSERNVSVSFYSVVDVMSFMSDCNLTASLPVKYWSSRSSLFSSRQITRRTVNRRKYLLDGSRLSPEVYQADTLISFSTSIK